MNAADIIKNEMVHKYNAQTRQNALKFIDVDFKRIGFDEIMEGITLGGETIRDIAAGQATIDPVDNPDLIKAFEKTYPNIAEKMDINEFLSQNAENPAALQGAISGLKGKMFEMDLVDKLNSEGYIAELAESPTQPGFDILIKNSDGVIIDELSAKATWSVDYAKSALETYPEIDIAVNDEIYEEMNEIAQEYGADIFETGIPLEDLEAEIDLDLKPDSPFGLPLITYILIIVDGIYKAKREGKSLKEILSTNGPRAIKATIGYYFGQAIAVATGSTILGGVSTLSLYLLLNSIKVKKIYTSSLSDILKRVEKAIQDLEVNPAKS